MRVIDLVRVFAYSNDTQIFESDGDTFHFDSLKDKFIGRFDTRRDHQFFQSLASSCRRVSDGGKRIRMSEKSIIPLQGS